MNDFSYNFDEFENNQHIQVLVKKFEKMLLRDEYVFYDIEDLETIIDYYLQSQNLIYALKAIEFSINQYPEEESFLEHKAYILLSINNTSEAKKIAEYLISMDATNPEGYIIMAEVYTQLDLPKYTIQYLKHALKYAEDVSEIYINIAISYHYIGDDVLAFHYIKKVEIDSQKNEQLLFDLCFCCDLIDKNDYLITYLLKYIDDAPYSFIAWLNLGHTYLKQNLIDKAIWAYDYAIIIDSHSGTAHFCKGTCLLESELYHEALELFKITLEIDGPSEILFNYIGECYYELNDISQARSYYKMTLKLNSESAEACYGMAMTYKDEQKYKLAIGFIKRALKLDADATDYIYEYAEILLEMKEYDKAFQQYELLLKTSENVWQVWCEMAYILFEKGEIDQAIQHLLRANQQHPENHFILYRLASYYYENLNKQLSFNYLAEALAINPIDWHLYYEFSHLAKISNAGKDLINLHQK